MNFLDPGLWAGRIHSGGWLTGDGGSHDVREPATGLTLGTVGHATPAQVRAAATEAARAQRPWAQATPQTRATVLRRAAELFGEHADEISDWLVRESGGTRLKADREIAAARAECLEAAALPTHPAGEVLATNSDRWSFARRRPVGVVSVIAPFNFPLTLAIRSVAPALGLGNSVLLKPDPRTSVSGGVVLQRVFEEAGLPSGVLHLLPGAGDVGEAVVTAPEVRVISFTGSTAAGRRVGEAAARLLKRAHLELGGNNALVVLPGADIELATSAGAFGSFLHQGQICMATGRHLVHRDVYEAYATRLAERADALRVGDPFRQDVQLGPVIDEGQLAGIDAIVAESVRAGARVRAGGRHEGLLYRPTVLTELDATMPAWTQEIFGPVAPILPFDDVDEVADLVNASEYGLAVGILGDVGAAMRLADRVDAGKVHINEQTVGDEAYAPMGGVGASGTGSRFGGATANIEAFTETQWVTVKPEIEHYPF